MDNNLKHAWSVWIDENKKIITFKAVPNARQVYFETREIGMKTVSGLMFKGYKIG